jgi:hypothetical protein
MKEKFRPQPDNQQPMSPEAGAGPLGVSPPDQNQSSLEGERDYSAMVSSIRADQDSETFVSDLRKNGEQLLSLADNLMRKPAETPELEGTNLAVGIYLDAVLKMHIFDIDPFASKHPGDEQIQEDRAAVANEIVSRVALKWHNDHPYSKAAREVARLGIFAFPWDHQELLQEMWSSFRVVAKYSQLQKKK